MIATFSIHQEVGCSARPAAELAITRGYLSHFPST
jgi:hypothetical protein